LEEEELASSIVPPLDTFHVVAIGSSAGGLEALRLLFHSLPVGPQFSYVVAQHLAPQHSSMLTELLARETLLNVRQLEQDTEMQPGTIYVTAPNHDVVYRSGFLRLQAPNPRGPKPSVDALLSSLAEELPHRSVAIILSGSGSDGAIGVRRLKSAGGVILAQEPKTAKYSSMPQSAIATGCVNRVLPPEQIGLCLRDYIEKGEEAVSAPPSRKRTAEVDLVLEKISLATNIDFRGYKSNTISRRINQRLLATRSQSLRDYIALLDNDREEVKNLAQNCLVSVTSFYREAANFETLGELIRLRSSGSALEPYRVWVPGCATGEEPYTISMALTEMLPGRRIQIFGTDLDEEAIALARRGIYAAAQTSTVPPEMATRFLRETALGFQVDRSIRDRVVFARHDLLRDPLFMNLDLISCRNLLIYLKPELQEEVMRKFHHALKPGGLLFLGRSEHAQSDYFDAADRKARIYINKPMLESEKRVPVTRDWSGLERETHNREAFAQAKDPARFQTLLMQHFAPPAALIDETFRIIETHGEVGRYLQLQPGKPQFTLLSLVPRNMMGALRAQIQRSVRTAKSTKGVPRQVKVNGKPVMLQTTVVPAPGQDGLYMVCFQETPLRGESTPIITSLENEEQLRELERELMSTRENLQAVVEELETSNEELQALNEELQSSNEEMQASNEELQSSNEELQSTNEELLTVNEELEHKSIELSFSIEDLENIQNSLEAALFVTDARGYFRHINEDARKLFGLSVEHLNGPMLIPNETGLALQVAAKIRKILETGEKTDFQADYLGRRFRISVQPYIGLHKATRGALVVFHDISEFVHMTEKLRRSESRLQLLANRQEATLNAVPAHVAMLDARGQIQVVNEAWRNFAGANGMTDQRFGVGTNYIEICERAMGLNSDGAIEMAAGLKEVLAGQRERFEFSYPCHGPGVQRWFRMTATGLRDQKNRGAVVMHSDVTELYDLIERLKLKTAALDSSTHAVFLTDTEGRIEWVNSSVARLCGYANEELLGQQVSILESANSKNALSEVIGLCRVSGESWKGELECARQDGSLFTGLLSVNVNEGLSEDPSHLILSLEDTSSAKRAQERMRYLAEHDELTNLWNRKTFIARLDEALQRQSQRGGRVAVLFLDLDRFKDTNDTLGHLAGDRMLLEIALRLRANLQAPERLARFGGDEFVMFLEPVNNLEGIDFAVNRVLQSFNRPIEVDGRQIFVSSSIGVTIFPDDGQSSEVLLRNADLAMYRAKAEGRRGYRFYDKQLEADINERVSIESDLSRAISSKCLWVAYQPQIDLRTGDMIGAESLLRWKTGLERSIPMGKVIAIAEESGLILSIGDWVMKESLQQARDWKRQGKPLTVSVNLSAVQFNQQDVFGLTMQYLRNNDLPTSSLKVEITETVLLNRYARVRETLHALHGAGVGLVLDDFGTGYSSLTYLQQFPIEAVKIDASFLRGIGRDGNDEAIVKGIIKLAHSLGQKVVAEGVETQEQLDFLRAFECDSAQGFLFSHPMQAKDFDQHRIQSVVH
jgi:two-component system, chemotaxis family, CheB/CheR fusion protein